MKRLSLVTVVLVATVVGADSRGLTAGAVAAGPITFSLGQAVPVGLVFGVTTADFNGDGHLDLAATNSVFSGTGVQVFLGAGDGTFSGGTHYPTGVCATPVTARDLNRDGKIDLLVGNYCATRTLVVLWGNGDGTFGNRSDYAIPGGAQAVAVGDFNGDDWPDIATNSSNGAPSLLTVYFNNGSGGFSSRLDLVISPNNFCWGHGMVSEDFNEDGLDDIAVTAGYDGTAIFLARPAGGFSPVVIYPYGSYGINGLAAGDFNNDAHVDLVMNTTVLLGAGNGTFAPVAGTTVGSNEAEVGDFNRDGRLDIVVAHEYASRVDAVVGRGDGTFEAPSGAGVTNTAIESIVGDFNEDGRPDVAVTLGRSVVQILLNTTAPADASPPVIVPILTGTLGNNGWYVSDVTVNWSVSDPQSVITSTSGCTTATVSNDTAGTTLSCTATSYGGTVTQSAVVKKDTTPPAATVTQPAWGSVIAVGAVVSAAYSCSDLVSDIASCTGTVAIGGPIHTATAGARAFSVTATDQAGNSSTTAVGYSVFTPTDGRNTWLWRNAFPSRHVAVFPDGTLAMTTWNNVTVPLIDPATGSLTHFPGGFPQGSSGVAPNPVVWADAGSAYLIGGWAGPTAYRQDGVFKWRWDNEFGCCNNMGVPNMAVDRGRRRLLLSLGTRLYYLPLDTGANPTFAGAGNAIGHVTATGQVAYVAGFTRDLTKWNISGDQPVMAWTRQLSTAFDTWNFSEGAITADGSFVVTRSGSHASPYWAGGDIWRAGDLHYVAADNSSAWSAEAKASTPPVIGRSGLIYVGGPVDGSPQSQLNGPGVVTAYSALGQIVWTTPTAGLPQDLLIGDDNRLYVAVGGSTEGAVLALDANTGALALAIDHVPSPWEIVLRSGVIYVTGDAGIVALPLSAGFAVNYDRQAPWPVRQHNNQRTSLGGDTTAPVVTVPGNLTVEAASSAGAAVTFATSALDDMDGSVPVSCAPASGSVFALGTTTVTCTASDGAGNAATVSFAVTVRDMTAPMITQLVSPGDVLLGAASVPVMIRLTDSVGVTRVIANGVSLSLQSGSALDGVWQGPISVTPFQQLTVSVTAEDAGLNSSARSFVIDNDGINAGIDRDRTNVAIDQSSLYSSDFNDGRTIGVIDRQVSVVQARSLNVDGLQTVELSLTQFTTGPGNLFARAYVCAGSPPKYVSLNSFGERAAVACLGNSNSTLNVKALAAFPMIDAYRERVVCNWFGRCRLYIDHFTVTTGQSVSFGSPVTADPGNTEPVSVEVIQVNDDGTQDVVGTYQLDPGEAVDVEIRPADSDGEDQIVFSVLQGEVTVTLGTDVVTVAAGQTATARVDQLAQTVGFLPISTKLFGDPAFALDATASSELPVTYTATGACTLSGSTLTPVGTGSCSVTASQPGDLNYQPAPAVTRTFAIWHAWSGILQPVNGDGSSIFKLGRTVPVKFELTGASASVTNLQARIYVAKISNSVVGTEVEATSTASGDTGNTFRYDAPSGTYIFNWGTQGLTTGTWQIRVDLLDGNPARIVVVSLRQ